MPVALSLTASGDEVNPTDPHTFVGVSLGIATADRIIVVGFGYDDADGGGSPIASVTIGGVTAGRAIVDQFTSYTADIWYASVPSGTTGNIVVDGPSGVFDTLTYGIYRLVGANLTPTDTDNFTVGSGASTLSNLTVPSGGAAILAFYNDDSTAVTWGGATEDVDASVSGIVDRYSFASTLIAGTNVITATGGSDQQALVGTAWGPSITVATFPNRNITEVRYR